METGGRTALERSQLAAWLGRSFGPWWVRIAGGGVIDGHWRSAATDLAVTSGFVGGVSVARTWWQASGWQPFGRSTFALAAARHGVTAGGSVTAGDLRVGGDLGWRLGAGAEVYASARVFGGPVVLVRPGVATDIGDDHWHVQLGGGIAWTPPVGWGVRPSAFAEAMLLGELGVSAGLALGW